MKPVITMSRAEAKKRLMKLFAKSRKAPSSMTEQEIDKLVEDAILEVRQEQRQKTAKS